MRECCRWLPIQILAGIILSLLASPRDCFSEELAEEPRLEYGLSLLGGWGSEDNENIYLYAAYPRFGWFPFKRWLLELEGNISLYRVKSIDMTGFGLNGLISYELLQFDGWSTFLAGGAGLLHLDVDERRDIGSAEVVGLAQAGFGIKLPVGRKTLLRFEYRFQHVSDPFTSNDGGINYHCLVLGISGLVF